MSAGRGYERPGGRVEGAPKRRLTPRLLRGKPLRRLQREFYQRYYRYPHRNILVTALPKSGSTWMERMLLDVPGHFRWFPKEFNQQTMKDEDFHELPRDDMLSPPAGYTITKVHSGPTAHNCTVLTEANRPFVVLIRDPRDIAVSWSHFVRIRPENAYHDETSGMSTEERINHFIDVLLDPFLEWAMGWQAHGPACRGMVVRYESMVADTPAVLQSVIKHLELPMSAEWVAEAAERHSFRNATGREPGQSDTGSFNRKGISGDWVNHFTDVNMARFRRIDDGRMQQIGYELDS